MISARDAEALRPICNIITRRERRVNDSNKSITAMSDEFATRQIKKPNRMVGASKRVKGFEPSVFSLARRRFATKLHPRNDFYITQKIFAVKLADGWADSI